MAIKNQKKEKIEGGNGVFYGCLWKQKIYYFFCYSKLFFCTMKDYSMSA